MPGINGAVNEDDIAHTDVQTSVLFVGGLVSSNQYNAFCSCHTSMPLSNKSRVNFGPNTSLHMFSKNVTGMMSLQGEPGTSDD